MIQIVVTDKTFNNVIKIIDSKVKQLEFVASPTALTEISKSIFTITSKRFLEDLAFQATHYPKKFHHLYEWDFVGHNSKKLFLIKRSHIQYGQLEIELVFLQSTTPVPIQARLLQPARTRYSRRSVVSARHIFRDKASIMEDNNPIHIYTKRTIVFVGKEYDGNPENDYLVFVPKDKVINIMNPGGNQTTHALQEFSQYWFKIKAPLAISQSNLIKQIGNRVAKVVNKQGSSISQVYNEIKQVNFEYSQEITFR
jgi:hypothetical protein